MLWLGRAAEDGALPIAVLTAGSVFDQDQRRRWLLSALVPPTAIAVNLLVKEAVRRPRPVDPRSGAAADAVSRHSCGRADRARGRDD